ncbi:multidrug ABC transporter substrate-binding protein [Niastella yeongjuensis]|uniref:Multidrug ABC transporter substrate-binding protein n=1 Tax=Niastella yeongjuensis TaxID=354355 RepID=A0A1V9EXC9_9BACT|nr:ABC transporter permease [Niastella yeongjuensis]OQP50777.1 multidrug ABC transporter substrate-binding protein [Niastella yeongjuensis]SEN18343.1 putative ABC transport system permease protein [Niastella yeongjuensis]
MKLFNLIRIALKALQRNKLRAFLTMLGIIIGVASVIAMVAIGQGSKQSIQDQLSSMGSNMITIRPNSNQTVGGGARLDATGLQSLTLDDIKAIQKQATYITAVSPAVQAKGQAINGALNWPTTIQGVSPDYLTIRNWPLKDGITFTQEHVNKADKVCLIGQTVVENIFGSEDPVGKIIRFNKIPFKVIGVLGEKGENAFGQDQDDIIIAPYTTVQKRILAIPYIQNIYASAIDEKSSAQATAEITDILRTSHKLKAIDDDDFLVRTQAELINTFSSTSQLLTVLLAAIAGISLVVGGIGIMNIMYVSVTERTKEIGLRMSIGAQGTDILFQFLIEAILISITGGIIGVILGITASRLVTLFLSWPTLVSQSSIMLSFMVCAITGVFFGYYPAQKASRLDPIEALRYE